MGRRTGIAGATPRILETGVRTNVAEELDKYEDEIVEVGKEKGYLTFGEVNDLLPGDITSPDDLDDLLTPLK